MTSEQCLHSWTDDSGRHGSCDGQREIGDFYGMHVQFHAQGYLDEIVVLKKKLGTLTEEVERFKELADDYKKSCETLRRWHSEEKARSAELGKKLERATFMVKQWRKHSDHKQDFIEALGKEIKEISEEKGEENEDS
jgi:uncharacterized coiled-coil DUF342 family protein